MSWSFNNCFFLLHHFIPFDLLNARGNFGFWFRSRLSHKTFFAIATIRDSWGKASRESSLNWKALKLEWNLVVKKRSKLVNFWKKFHFEEVPLWVSSTFQIKELSLFSFTSEKFYTLTERFFERFHFCLCQLITTFIV